MSPIYTVPIWAALYVPICPILYVYMYIYTYIYSPICPLYIYSPLSEQPPIYTPLTGLGSGTNNAGQLTAIHTTCRGVARLVLLRHATGRAIRSTRTTSRASGRGKSCNCRTTGESYDQPRQWRTTRDLSPDHRTTVARQMTTRLRQDATTSVILVVRISKTNHD